MFSPRPPVFVAFVAQENKFHFGLKTADLFSLRCEQRLCRVMAITPNVVVEGAVCKIPTLGKVDFALE